MKNLRNAQIVVFIIIGIAVLAATGLLYYIVSSTAQQRSSSQLEQQRLAAELVQPVDDYVTACLKQISLDALEIAGKQGGVIWSSQGGLTQDGAADNSIPYDTAAGINLKVAYGLKMPIYSDSRKTSEVPNYPRKNFPEGAGGMLGYFGNYTLPTLQAIESDIESYISNKLSQASNCINNWNDFTARGIKVEAKEQDRKVNAQIANSSIAFTVSWPLTIISSTGQKVIKDSFVANQPIRFKKAFTFADALVADERSIGNFDISGKNSGDGMSTTVLKQGNNEIVKITDPQPQSRIAGNQFEFRFAVQNRPASLNFIQAQNFCEGATISLSGGAITISKTPPSAASKSIPLAATDPDGDTGLAFFVYFQAGATFGEQIQSTPKSIGSTRKIIVKVTDNKGGAQDFQENITLTKTC